MTGCRFHCHFRYFDIFFGKSNRYRDLCINVPEKKHLLNLNFCYFLVVFFSQTVQLMYFSAKEAVHVVRCCRGKEHSHHGLHTDRFGDEVKQARQLAHRHRRVPQ